MTNRALPKGTVAFLLTDVESSTALWERYEGPMREAMALHDAIAAEIAPRHHGHLVKARGEGDSHFFVFSHTGDALAAAADLMATLRDAAWPEAVALKVRMAVHTGEVQLRDGDYYGPAVNRAARLRAAGHGGQILVGGAAAALGPALPEGGWLEDLGERRLKDLLRPERVHALRLPGDGGRWPPLLTVDRHPNNLPPQLTSFVGRTRELARLRDILPTGRLTTILGVGGGGKTRLAIQLGAESVDRFPDGVWFADLSRATPGEGLPGRIAGSVGLLTGYTPETSAELAERLAPHRALLVLDNCEGLALGPTVAEILAAAPDVSVVATSREPLGVEGERLFALPPLSVPGPHMAPVEMMDCDAARLFVERAGLARDDFELTERNAPAVADICRRLDGLPLAIEQVAAGVLAAEPDELLDDLAHHLAVPRAGAAGRHVTMRACTNWSVDRLPPEERIVFRRLAIFAGGCENRGARAVIADADLAPARVTEALRSLLLKSLVTTVDGHGGRRHRLLEPIREVAAELLQAEEADPGAIEARFRAHYGDLAREIGPKVETAEQPHALGVLDDEAANVRRAVDEAVPDELPEIVFALVGWANRRGHLPEVRTWHERALAKGAFPGPGRRAVLVNSLGTVHWKLGAYAEARAAYEEVAGMLAPEDPEYRVAYARSRNNLALLAVEEDRLEDAEGLYREAHAAFVELGQAAHAATVLSNLGPLVANLGRPEEGLAHLEDALDGFAELGNRAKVARVHSNLLAVLAGAGRHREAAEHGEAALRIWRAVMDRTFVGEGLLDVARIALATGRPRDAAVLLGAADALVAGCGTMLDRFQKADRAGTVAALEEALDRSERRALLARGAALSAEAAVELALPLCAEIAGV